MFKRVGTKVAFQVNVVLLIAMAIGIFYLAKAQHKDIEEQLVERETLKAVIGAKVVGENLKEAIQNEVLTEREVFDTHYVEIPGFEPAKYHTAYDAHMDKAILPILDEFLKDKSIVYAIAVDRNGYVPTHNSRYQQDITGDKDKDRKGNQTKRLLNDENGLKAAQNTKEGLIQRFYNKDVDMEVWDIAAPIYVSGKYWGNFRIGCQRESLEGATEQAVMRLLMTIMGIILLISIFLVFFIVNHALKPLTKFTEIASSFANGNVDEPIVATSKDEIGRLADVLERLRVSLKMAISRLSKKG
jgi:methyl-accepting chemotaxis protein